jgi:hypothetical protein
MLQGFFDWLYRWQTLVAGLFALAAAWVDGQGDEVHSERSDHSCAGASRQTDRRSAGGSQ